MESAVNFIEENFSSSKTWKEIKEMLFKAKEIEKQQIVMAFEAGSEAMERFNDQIPDADECIYLESGSDYYAEHYC